MKSNFFKYIFILFVVGIIIFAIYSIYFKEDKIQNDVIETNKEEVVEIKELRLGISNFDTINPLLRSNKEVINIDKLIFEPLITIDENYRG